MKRIPKEVWLTPQEVGQMAGGFTAAFIRLEIKAGALKADRLPPLETGEARPLPDSAG
jgi:hypothetical protein